MPYEKPPITVGEDKNLKQWFTFPESLEGARYRGYEVREDQTQVKGAFVVGQNVTLGNSQLPSLRDGMEQIGTNVATNFPIKRAWIYETRDGYIFELRAHDTQIDFYLQGYSTDYIKLLDGFTTGLEFGYGNISRQSGITGATIFCNGTDDFYKFTGAFAIYTSDNGVDQITIQGSEDIMHRLFTPDGKLSINGTVITYTTVNGNTFKGCSSIPVGMVAGTTLIVQTPMPMDGTDAFEDWNGVYATYASYDGVTQLTMQGTTALSALGFTATGKLRHSGIDTDYSAISGETFTIAVIPNTFTVGDVISQRVATPLSLSTLKGKVIMAHDGRLHARQESKKSVWNYSKLDNPYDFSTSSLDGSGGAKEVEFGGPIIAFGKLNQGIVAFKNRMLKFLDFIQVGTRLDSPRYQTLVSVDDKGTTLGAINQRSTFSTPMGLVFVTPDKRMVLLTGVTANNQPQYLFLSDPIQPVFTNGVHDECVGICVDNFIYYSFKQNIDSTTNDVVLKGNMLRHSLDTYGRVIPIQWDTPYIGWNANDFTVLYNRTLGKNEVHFHSSQNPNSFRIITDKSDNTASFSTTLRTWSESFGAPDLYKLADLVYVEIKMLENSVVTATILLDEDGVTSQSEYTLSGTDTENLFDSSNYNPNGASSYGEEKIGSNPDSPNLKKYRYYLELPANTYFFNLSLQLSTDGEAQDYELIRHAVRIIEIVKEPDVKYKKGVN